MRLWEHWQPAGKAARWTHTLGASGISPRQSLLTNATAGSQVPAAQVADEHTSAEPPVAPVLQDRSEYLPVVPGMAVHVPSGCMKLIIGAPVQVSDAYAFAETSRAAAPAAKRAATMAMADRRRAMPQMLGGWKIGGVRR